MRKIETQEMASSLANYLGYDLFYLSSKTRLLEPRIARQMIMTFMYSKRNLFRWSLQDVADVFNRDHATTLNSIKRVNNYRDTEALFRANYELFESFGNQLVLTIQHKSLEFMDKHSL